MVKIHNSNTIFIISGGSGSGKSAVIAPLHHNKADFCISVSHTTRPPRIGEVHGRDYHFVSDEVFNQIINSQDFLEWEHVHQHRYGTRKSDFLQLIESGKKVIIEIDVNGAMNIKKLFDKVVMIFIMVPDLKTALSRLKDRGSESVASIAIRQQRYDFELDKSKLYDHIIINDDLEKARDELASIINRH